MKITHYPSELAALGISLAAVTGCSMHSDRDATASASDTNVMMVQSQATNAVDADNSGRNDRDRSGNTLTAGDQGNSPEDRDLTQKIRKALVMDTSYSVTAKNIKIITANGKVTLRGPVTSDSEKAGVLALAKGIAGDANVDDQLEIKNNP